MLSLLLVWLSLDLFQNQYSFTEEPSLHASTLYIFVAKDDHP